MTYTKVTSIIINWNLKKSTDQCIQSLNESTYPNDILVVDNGSIDGSKEHLQEHHPGIDIIPHTMNHGFARACNAAIRKILTDTENEFIFLLNNDAIMHPTALSRMIEAAKEYPDAGIFGPKIYLRDPPEMIWYAGARQRKGLLAATDTGRYEYDHGQFDILKHVDYVFGAAMLIRRAVLESIGLFDESYFLYLEDLDFCLRAKAAGFSLLYVPQARVWHYGSASTSSNIGMRRYHYIRSTFLFLKKHLSTIWIAPAMIFWSTVLLRMILRDLAEGSGVEFVRNVVQEGATSGRFPTHRRGVEEYVVVEKGRLLAVLGGEERVLEEGDALYFEADVPHRFDNAGEGECSYYLVIVSKGT